MIKKISLVVLMLACVCVATLAADRNFTLCIDAGHGGKDTGAPGTFSVEKNINLNVALAFGRYVERNCPDVNVVYTRKTDVFVPLYERAEIANRKKASLFISVHTNALKGAHTARGFETYVLGDGRSHAKETNLEVAKRENSVIFFEKDYKQHYVGFDPNSPESNIIFEFLQDQNLSKSIDFAKMLQKHVCKSANRPNKGVHQQNLAVLRLTSMPACLIELGYISTPDEEQMLNNKQQIDNLARGIYNAFVEYKNKYDRGMTIPYKPMSDPVPDVDTEDRDYKTKQQVEVTDTKDEAMDMQTTAKTDIQPVNAKRQAVATNRVIGTSRKPGQQNMDNGKPVFKVQILVTGRLLKDGDANFKGLDGITYYKENGMYKYTYGESNNYNEVYRLRKSILDKFPQAFIIAFKNGEKMDVNQGIREFKQNRNK